MLLLALSPTQPPPMQSRLDYQSKWRTVVAPWCAAIEREFARAVFMHRQSEWRGVEVMSEAPGGRYAAPDARRGLEEVRADDGGAAGPSTWPREARCGSCTNFAAGCSR